LHVQGLERPESLFDLLALADRRRALDAQEVLLVRDPERFDPLLELVEERDHVGPAGLSGCRSQRRAILSWLASASQTARGRRGRESTPPDAEQPPVVYACR